jgi:AcrR family transcriptional regulator
VSETPDPKLTEKQQRVMEAALEVFAERGFHGSSTSEIAKRAGVAEGTLFKQFKSKKEILLGALSGVFARAVAPMLLSEVRAIMRAPHATPEDFLRALYSNRLEFVRNHDRVVRIAMQEIPFHPEVRELMKETVLKQIAPDATALVLRFQGEGKIRAGDPGSLVRLVVGAFLSYAVTRILVAPERAWDDAAEIELMVKVLAQGLAPDRAA